MFTSPARQGPWRSSGPFLSIDSALHGPSQGLQTPPAARPSGPITDRFGERLRNLRKAKGMTQVQLARHMGIDRSFISDVERGKKTISLDYLDTLARGFKLTLTELLDGL